MVKPNNTAAENAVRSKNVPPRTRRLAMNPLSTVRKIRACENEAAAQLLLERYAMSPQREPDPGQQWKCGDEFLPFHPQASHVPAEYRDGWNRCYWMAVTRGVEASPLDRLKRPGENYTDVVNRIASGVQACDGNTFCTPDADERKPTP
jgi:hypothetical protein